MMLTSIIVGLILLAIDLISKYMAQYMLLGKDIPLIGDWLGLTYTENNGGPYGWLGGNTTLLIIASIVAIVVLCVVIYYFRKVKYAPVALSIVAAGAFGNFFDRVVFGHVRDMIRVSIGDFSLTNFVCNIADIYLWIGIILFAIIILFFYKEDKVSAEDAEDKSNSNDVHN